MKKASRIRLWVILTEALLLFLAVPWFFTESSQSQFLGLPLWAVSILLFSVLYALFVAFCLGRYWNELEEGAIDDR